MQIKQGEFPVNDGPFEPNWTSLQAYECPEWFRDAKLGIWAHWGPQCVPMAGDWYARNIYIEGSRQYKHHLEHYGHPSEFGYKDIVKLWKAENFDPAALVKLYKQAGAKYFVALAVHHDNYDCWDSTYHRWNSVKIGPQKDIVGMWREAAQAEGLRFGVTEHLERCYSWFNTNKGADKYGPKAGVPYDGNLPEYRDFYNEPHGETTQAYPVNPSAYWQWIWYARMKDLVDKYQPDLLYTDGGIPFGEVGRKFVANFYNGSIQSNGQLEGVYTYKDVRQRNKEVGRYVGDFVDGVGTEDIERGLAKNIMREPWQTDTCVGNWYYNVDAVARYKDAEHVIHMFIDIVSKNGNLLLNFPLKPDGSLDEPCRKIVAGMGDWMSVNGEAIYGTRPWRAFGEGPTKAGGGEFKETKASYTSRDFRFTRKGDTLYAICMHWPEDGKLQVKSLKPDSGDQVKHVELLGHGPVDWQFGDDGLSVQLPDTSPCNIAYSLKIQTTQQY